MTTGKKRNPWLLSDLEAVCRGESVPEHTTAAKLEFLQQFITAMGADAWHPGAVMELVRYLFGREHPLFDCLAVCDSPASMLAALRTPQ